MRGFVATALVFSAVAACYGGAFLAAPEDDEPPAGAPDADLPDATREASIAEGGSSSNDASTVRRMFVTSTTVEGNFGGLEAADDECRKRASALGGTFKAWLSTTGVPAKDRFMGGRAIVLVNGDPVANDFAALVGGSIANVIAYDENGTKVGTQYVWTGTKADGTSTGIDCNDWAQATGEVGSVGSTGTADGGWSNAAALTCVTPARFYCIED